MADTPIIGRYNDRTCPNISCHEVREPGQKWISMRREQAVRPAASAAGMANDASVPGSPVNPGDSAADIGRAEYLAFAAF